MTALAGEESENDYLDDANVVYDITSFGADFLVDGLIRRLEDGDIYKPSFQRKFVWTLPQASRFIESILLGLPIPGIFLYREEETQQHLIIDGLQRLTTIHAFHKGYLPGSSRRFALDSVKERFEGKTIDDLEPTDRRRFQDAALHATIIQQNLPRQDNSAVFHIFERLNTGGTPLQAQEMRAAIYHGPFQDLLEELNALPEWRTIFGPINRRAKDQEFILRFFAMYHWGDDYQEPMKRFLNDFMSEHRGISKKQRSEFFSQFKETCITAVEAFGEKPFRPKRALNVAVFEACMVALAANQPEPNKHLKGKYQKLLGNIDFINATTRSTGSESNVKARLKLAMNALK